MPYDSWAVAISVTLGWNVPKTAYGGGIRWRV